MRALAVAIVIVALEAALAYAIPKMYWYSKQVEFITDEHSFNKDRLDLFKKAVATGDITDESNTESSGLYL
jgi:hypothetical protein